MVQHAIDVNSTNELSISFRIETWWQIIMLIARQQLIDLKTMYLYFHVAQIWVLSFGIAA